MSDHQACLYASPFPNKERDRRFHIVLERDQLEGSRVFKTCINWHIKQVDNRRGDVCHSESPCAYSAARVDDAVKGQMQLRN